MSLDKEEQKLDIVKIDGKAYNILVTELSEEFNILYDESTGRTVAQGGRMFLNPIGTFYGHKVTFKRRRGFEEEFDKLFDFLSIPRSEGFPVEIVHGQKQMSYDAYVSNGSRQLKVIRNEIAEWGEMQINFIPMEAQVIAE